MDRAGSVGCTEASDARLTRIDFRAGRRSRRLLRRRRRAGRRGFDVALIAVALKSLLSSGRKK